MEKPSRFTMEIASAGDPAGGAKPVSTGMFAEATANEGPASTRPATGGAGLNAAGYSAGAGAPMRSSTLSLSTLRSAKSQVDR